MDKKYFLTVCLNPTLQKTLIFDEYQENTVNRAIDNHSDASGKGINVSRVLKQLGESVVHLTQVGGREREYFLSLAADDGVKCFTVDSGTNIRYCYTVINLLTHTTTELIETTEKISNKIEFKLYELFSQLLPNSNTLIISGTKATGFSDEIFPEMVKRAKRQGKKVILDLKGNDLINSLSYQPDIIKPNLSEFIETFFPNVKASENNCYENILPLIEEKMLQIYNEYHIISILTRGKDGVIYTQDGKVLSKPASVIQPINTIGSGDAFTAGFAASWNNNNNNTQDLSQAIENGLKCAKLNALSIRPGTIR